MIFHTISSLNIDLLHLFLKSDFQGCDHFNYFKSRPLSVIDNHIITIIGTINNVPVSYSHIDFENNIFWIGICILKNYQSKGYGSIILNKLITIAKEKKINILSLTVDKNNHNAIKLYEKHGFQISSNSHKSFLMKYNTI